MLKLQSSIATIKLQLIRPDDSSSSSHSLDILQLATSNLRFGIVRVVLPRSSVEFIMAAATTTAAAAGEGKVWQHKGYSTVSSYVVANGAQKVVDFATEVLGAETLHKMLSDDGGCIRHCSLRIGDTTVMLSDGCKENPAYAAFPAWLHVYVPDVDATYKLALSKDGVESFQVPRDEFYGDRIGGVKDAVGNVWWISTHKFEPKCVQCPAAAPAQEAAS